MLLDRLAVVLDRLVEQDRAQGPIGSFRHSLTIHSMSAGSCSWWNISGTRWRMNPSWSSWTSLMNSCSVARSTQPVREPVPLEVRRRLPGDDHPGQPAGAELLDVVVDHEGAHRPAQQHGLLELERGHEPLQVPGVVRDGVAGRRVARVAMASQVNGDHPVALAQRLQLAVEVAAAHRDAVDQDQRLGVLVPALVVGQGHAIGDRHFGHRTPPDASSAGCGRQPSRLWALWTFESAAGGDAAGARGTPRPVAEGDVASHPGGGDVEAGAERPLRDDPAGRGLVVVARRVPRRAPQALLQPRVVAIGQAPRDVDLAPAGPVELGDRLGGEPRLRLVEGDERNRVRVRAVEHEEVGEAGGHQAQQRLRLAVPLLVELDAADPGHREAAEVVGGVKAGGQHDHVERVFVTVGVDRPGRA